MFKLSKRSVLIVLQAIRPRTAAIALVVESLVGQTRRQFGLRSMDSSPHIRSCPNNAGVNAIMEGAIKALVYVGRLQQAMRDLNDKLSQTGLPTTLWFDIILSESGVLVQGFLDVELPNGNAVSHDLDFVASGSKCSVSSSQRRITPKGSDLIKSTGEMECATIEELGSAMSACERFIKEISISDVYGESPQ